MKMNWKAKARTFATLDKLPAGDRLYYLLQRRVTKSLPRQYEPTDVSGSARIEHAMRFTRLGVDLREAYVMEFGAGWDLYSNLLLYCLGVNHQRVIDVRRLMKPELVNAAIKHLRRQPPTGAIRRTDMLVNDEVDLRRYYGIDYDAPADARAIPVAPGTFDLIITTSTLEHIPADILSAIMRECHRVLKADGLMSHTIDYSDHYALTDPDITFFNYLRFDDKEWHRYSPDIHYQNRLRTPFYRHLFEASGFQVIEYDSWRGQKADLDKVPVNPLFYTLKEDELLELGGKFVLRKQPALVHDPRWIEQLAGTAAK